MNERLIEVVERVVSWIEAGGQFAVEQMPLVVSELIVWGRVSNTTTLLLGLICFVFGLKSSLGWMLPVKHFDVSEGVVRSHRFWVVRVDGLGRSEFLTLTPTGIVRGLVFPAVGLIGLVTMLAHLNVTLQVWFAPRLFVLEYLGKLL